ncbi:hypothetical protein ACFLT9_06905 [Acidobacteriota bacterium]
MIKRFLGLTLGFIVCFVVFSGVYFAIEAQTQKTLTVRTWLRPVGWPKNNNYLHFAPGNYRVDDFDGGVQSGILDQEALLKIWNSNSQVLFGPGFIRFERAGGVKEGTLPYDTTLCITNTASDSKLILSFKGKTTVEFGYDGCVMKGTLAKEATLKSWDGGSKTYPPGTLVDFNGAGLVTEAVLPPTGAPHMDGQYNGTCTIDGIGTFPFNFNASNGVFKGSIDKPLYSLQWQGNYDKAGTIQNGWMTGWVDVIEGGQKTRWTVRGPIQGTITAAASRGTLSITTADGSQTWTGNWTAAVGSSAIQPCDHYLGPIEPLRIPSAGSSQTPGTYWLVWADVPRTTVPKEQWNWKKHGPVTLKGGKRYFIVFGRSLPVSISEESGLPIQETQVVATPDSAIIWHENDSSNGARIAYCFQAVPVSIGKPELHIDLSPLDDLKTNQTITMTATAENIPLSITKLKFYWMFGWGDCISGEPPGQISDSSRYTQFIAPVNGKATCSVTYKADSEPREPGFMLLIQDEPYTKVVFLSVHKRYSIR